MKDTVILVILISLFSGFYYDSVLDKGPLNTHIWRQSDCLSITSNYAKGASFLDPQLHTLSADNYSSGKSAGEFPILYFTIGQLWKITGESFFVYRLVYLSILITSLILCFKALHLMLKNTVWSIVLTLLLYTSPVFVFYGVSFLTDAPAFSFVIIALYFFTLYAIDKKHRNFFISMLFFALAGLIKISSLIAFIFLAGVFFIERIRKIQTLGSRKLFIGSKTEWIGLISVFVVIVLWYAYAFNYNQLHGFKYTYNSIHPFWLIEKFNWEAILASLKNFTSHSYYSRFMIFSMLLIGIVNLLNYKKLPMLANLSNLFIPIGGLIYMLLWLPLLGNHDYYFIALLIVLPGILFPFAWLLKIYCTTLFNSKLTALFISIFLFLNFAYCYSHIHLKTRSNESLYYLIGNHQLVKHMKWVNWDAQTNLYRYYRMRSYLSDIGIDKDDLVISMNDNSFSISLYFMDRNGWSNHKKLLESKKIIKTLIERNAKYLVISDKVYLTKPFLQPFLSDQIGEFEGIRIFKL